MKFNPSKKFTLGVEQELQLINSETRDLKACSLDLLTKLGEQQKIVAEIFQSMIEVRTGICKNAFEAFRDLKESHQKLLAGAESMNIQLASSGSHPFARYIDRQVFPAERYHYLIDRNQWIARRLMIFGLHVHVGMPDGDTAIRIANRMHYYMPFLLALSGSSPFWDSQDTGLNSCRITVFEAIPTGGHNSYVKNWDDFVGLTEKLRRSGGIESLKDIWWDIRPNADYGTIELRICDTPHRIDQIAALTALVHMLAEYLETAPPTPMDEPEDWWVRENKWRASRYGLKAALITSPNGDCTQAETIWHQLKKDLRPLIEKYSYQPFIEMIDGFFVEGTCSDRQKSVFAQTESLMAVVDFIIDEHKKGVRAIL